MFYVNVFEGTVRFIKNFIHKKESSDHADLPIIDQSMITIIHQLTNLNAMLIMFSDF